MITTGTTTNTFEHVSQDDRDVIESMPRRQRWSGLLAPYGRPTGDGRVIEGNIATRALPLFLRWQAEDQEGHGGAVAVGRILAAGSLDEVRAEGYAPEDQGEGIYGGGDMFDASSYSGASADAITAAAQHMSDGLGLVSVDLVDCDAEFQGDMLVVRSGTMAAATLVGVPAFGEARVAIADDDTERVQVAGSGRTRLLELSMTFAQGDAAIGLAPDLSRTYVVTGSTGLPIGPERGWDGPRAAGRMLDAATGEGGTINVRDASRGFFWHDDDGSNRGDYKLPFADLVDGRLVVIPAGVRAVLSRLPGTDIPDSARTTIEGKARGLMARIERSQDAAARQAAELADGVAVEESPGEESPGEDDPTMAALDERMQAATIAGLDARMGIDRG